MEKIKITMDVKEDKKQLEEMYLNYLNCPEAVKNLSNLGMSEKTIRDNIVKINNYVSDLKYCLNCKGAKNCKKDRPLLVTNLVFKNGVVIQNLEPCEMVLKQMKIENKFLINDIDEKFLDASISKIDHSSKTRSNDLFITINNILNNKTNKWLYLKGSLGTGKSYIASAISNTASKKLDWKICFLDCSYRFKELNDLSYSDKNEFAKLMNAICNCDLLILDGFGDEYKNDFIRDGILYNIVSNRMNNKKMIIFTSEFSIDEIRELYSFNKAGAIRSKQISNILQNACQVIDLGDFSIYL